MIKALFGKTKQILFLSLMTSFLQGASLSLVKEGFLFKEAPFTSCHAPSLTEQIF